VCQTSVTLSHKHFHSPPPPFFDAAILFLKKRRILALNKSLEKKNFSTPIFYTLTHTFISSAFFF
jgi:hypothetical protein